MVAYDGTILTANRAFWDLVGNDETVDEPIDALFPPYEMLRKSGALAVWGVFEIVLFLSLYVAAGIANSRFICFFIPFYYFGHCLSYLNGYYLHFGGNPKVPLAWGVSSYHKLYNWLWFNNGYHAEHHYRPRVHWTRMEALHKEIRQQQKEAGVRVIRPPHAFGFLDPDLADEPLVPVEKPLNAALR